MSYVSKGGSGGDVESMLCVHGRYSACCGKKSRVGCF